ncbi:bypass of stop codon protein 1 [Salmo salar]|uniref:Bypass of stop codon protein 1 n=1 Tax=Salmo salar TaxID=8030 RepID=A0ABM3DS09_SALSA|nr:bypass of stop codon protein 1-like [Salmo salar]
MDFIEQNKPLLWNWDSWECILMKIIKESIQPQCSTAAAATSTDTATSSTTTITSSTSNATSSNAKTSTSTTSFSTTTSTLKPALAPNQFIGVVPDAPGGEAEEGSLWLY